jgi:hypothetical protein
MRRENGVLLDSPSRDDFGTEVAQRELHFGEAELWNGARSSYSVAPPMTTIPF